MVRVKRDGNLPCEVCWRGWTAKEWVTRDLFFSIVRNAMVRVKRDGNLPCEECWRGWTAKEWVTSNESWKGGRCGGVWEVFEWKKKAEKKCDCLRRKRENKCQDNGC